MSDRQCSLPLLSSDTTDCCLGSEDLLDKPAWAILPSLAIGFANVHLGFFFVIEVPLQQMAFS